MLEIGKLYICQEYFPLLYPDPATAAIYAHSATTTVIDLASSAAAHWSNQLGKAVSYADKNIPLLVINSKDKCIEVLAGNRKGWIIYKDWLNIKEIV